MLRELIIYWVVDMEISELVMGGEYNFKNQKERLVYLGKNLSGNGYQHQFAKVGSDGVWCELLDGDIDMIESTNEQEYL